MKVEKLEKIIDEAIKMLKSKSKQKVTDYLISEYDIDKKSASIIINTYYLGRNEFTFDCLSNYEKKNMCKNINKYKNK